MPFQRVEQYDGVEGLLKSEKVTAITLRGIDYLLIDKDIQGLWTNSLRGIVEIAHYSNIVAYRVIKELQDNSAIVTEVKREDLVRKLMRKYRKECKN